MKKKCILFGNCHCHGVNTFLKLFSNFHNLYDVTMYANWQLIMNNDTIPIKQLQEADLVIYQPLSDVHNCYSTNRENPQSFFNLLKPECTTIAFPRIHNNAIFPVFHKSSIKPDMYGKIINKVNSIHELISLYESNHLDYDFHNRMEENYCISKLKEKNCEVKIVDFIFENIKKHKLFLTQDHPTSIVFNEVTRQICGLLKIEYDYEKGMLTEENISNLGDSVYNSKNKQYPISRYAINYFGFEYVNNEDTDANEFYKKNTRDYFINHYK